MCKVCPIKWSVKTNGSNKMTSSDILIHQNMFYMSEYYAQILLGHLGIKGFPIEQIEKNLSDVHQNQ